MLRISKRLKTLAGFVPGGCRAADIGTDHAFLPVFLVKEKISPHVIAVDVNEKPLEAARKNVSQYQAEEAVELRLGDGLAALLPHEAEVLIVAGLGGGTIRDILAAAPEVTKTPCRLILQPMTDAEALRLWLSENSWVIIEEELIFEDGRLFEIIVAEQGNPEKLSFAELCFGPRLLAGKHPLLMQLLEKEQTGLQEILVQLAKSNNIETEKKKAFFRKKKAMIEELLRWL
ncbi:MAG: class I SAM-dependent methyltransferase [Clostridia bacterium]|nr:class I SAM-dependent methyltransferase [Clostridia bacterium]